MRLQSSAWYLAATCFSSSAASLLPELGGASPSPLGLALKRRLSAARAKPCEAWNMGQTRPGRTWLAFIRV